MPACVPSRTHMHVRTCTHALHSIHLYTRTHSHPHACTHPHTRLYIYRQSHTHTHTHESRQTSAHIPTHQHTFTHTHTHTHTFMRTQTDTHECTHHTYMQTHYTRMCMCVCPHNNTQVLRVYAHRNVHMLLIRVKRGLCVERCRWKPHAETDKGSCYREGEERPHGRHPSLQDCRGQQASHG